MTRLPASNKPTANPYRWTNETVLRILDRVDYWGHTVNLKTKNQSYENTQPPIIEEKVFIIVQNIRKSLPTCMGDMGIFSGFVFCAGWGNKMHL